MRDVKIVVLYEGNATAERRVNGAPVYVLQVLFAGMICRMGFSREDDLYGSSERRQDVRQSLRVVENQFWAFVVSKPAGEAHGERRWGQERARRDHPGGGHAVGRPPPPGGLAEEGEEGAALGPA